MFDSHENHPVVKVAAANQVQPEVFEVSNTEPYLLMTIQLKRRNIMSRYIRFSLTILACLIITGNSLAQETPKSLTIATASTGGVYAVYGEGMASIISKSVGVKTSTRQTQGPTQNLVFVQTGQTELGMVTSGPAFEAVSGILDLKPGDKHEKVRALFAMYPTPFQMIALKASGISKIEDLSNKRLGAGPRGGTGGTYWPRWLKSVGISANIQFGGIGDQGAQLADGRLDAIVTAGGIPHPTLSELETIKDVTIFGMSDKVLAGILKSNPYAVEFVIPKATYKSLSGDIKTAAMWNFVVTNSDMSETLAYNIVKSVFENHKRLVLSHATAKDTLAENISHNTVLPLHPGAVRYYREIGVSIPKAILPPGMK